MLDINDCKSPDDVLRFMLDSPTEFIELLAADANAADGDTALRDRAFSLLKNATLARQALPTRPRSFDLGADLCRPRPALSLKGGAIEALAFLL
jgi:hypothetical protein